MSTSNTAAQSGSSPSSCSASLAELIEHVQKLLSEAEGWVERNTREGHPDAAESWKPKVEQYQRWLSTLRSMPNTDYPHQECD